MRLQKSVLLGELDKGKELAEKVQGIVGTDSVSDDYWQTATVAEVYLLLQKYKEAASLYQFAIDYAPSAVKSHISTRNQAKLLLEKLGASDDIRKEVLSVFAHLES